MKPARPLDADRLDATFSALADSTRRALLELLAQGEATVTELVEPFDISQPAISRHLKVLERAGLVHVERDGRRRPRRVDPEPLEEVTDWVERYREVLEANYRRLDALLEELQRGDPERATSESRHHPDTGE